MENIAVAIHIFLAVLILGTLWRLLSMHCMAMSSEHLQHLGKAMSTQY